MKGRVTRGGGCRRSKAGFAARCSILKLVCYMCHGSERCEGCGVEIVSGRSFRLQCFPGSIYERRDDGNLFTATLCVITFPHACSLRKALLYTGCGGSPFPIPTSYHAALATFHMLLFTDPPRLQDPKRCCHHPLHPALLAAASKP